MFQIQFEPWFGQGNNMVGSGRDRDGETKNAERRLRNDTGPGCPYFQVVAQVTASTTPVTGRCWLVWRTLQRASDFGP
jgi:hypothetical protein